MPSLKPKWAADVAIPAIILTVTAVADATVAAIQTANAIANRKKKNQQSN
jgi:hypothetical protein